MRSGTLLSTMVSQAAKASHADCQADVGRALRPLLLSRCPLVSELRIMPCCDSSPSAVTSRRLSASSMHHAHWQAARCKLEAHLRPLLLSRCPSVREFRIMPCCDSSPTAVTSRRPSPSSTREPDSARGAL